MLRSLARALPTSMGGILNAIAAVYFLQKGGGWIWLGIAHVLMVILLGFIASKKAKAADAQAASNRLAANDAAGEKR